MVSGNHRVLRFLDSLRHRLIGSMGNVDHHAQTVHLPNQFAPMWREALPRVLRAAGVGIAVIPVVRGKLVAAQPQAIEHAQEPQVAVQIETALQIQHRRHLPGTVDAFNIRRFQRDLNAVFVPRNLPQGQIHLPKRLLRFQPPGVIIFRDVKRKEQSLQPPFLGPRKVPHAIGLALAYVPTMIKFTINGMYMAVKHQCRRVQLPGTVI